MILQRQGNSMKKWEQEVIYKKFYFESKSNISLTVIAYIF